MASKRKGPSKREEVIPQNVEVTINSSGKVYSLNQRVIMLREPQFKLDDAGVLRSIVGLCSNTLDDGSTCDGAREIAPQDAFQVRFCIACVKLKQSRKISERRKAARKAARLTQLEA